jgi:hypothetical protein
VAKGGKREGAGRKKGALTKRTRAIAEQALATGTTPLEVMLENMRHFRQVALDAEQTIAGLSVEEMGGGKLEPEEQFKLILAQVKKAAGLRQMAQECARDAASYTHAKLSAITMQGNPDKPLKYELSIRFVSAKADE